MATNTKIRGTGAILDRVQDAVGLAFRRTEDRRTVAAKFAPTPGVNRVSSGLIVERYVIAAGATTTLDYDFPNGREIIDVLLKKTTAAGGGAGTIRVRSRGGDNITDAMSINVADETIVRAATVNDARHRITDGKIRFVRTRTASTDESCVAYVVTMPVT